MSWPIVSVEKVAQVNKRSMLVAMHGITFIAIKRLRSIKGGVMSKHYPPVNSHLYSGLSTVDLQRVYAVDNRRTYSSGGISQ